ncbi:HCc2, partial [Symbiodinium pilosum]
NEGCRRQQEYEGDENEGGPRHAEEWHCSAGGREHRPEEVRGDAGAFLPGRYRCNGGEESRQVRPSGPCHDQDSPEACHQGRHAPNVRKGSSCEGAASQDGCEGVS